MRVITLEQLRQHDACEDAIDRFTSTFGASVTVTPEAWAQARAVGLNVLWCARLLPLALRLEHNSRVAQIRETYDRACVELLRQMIPGSGEYLRQHNHLWRQYTHEQSDLLFSYLTTEAT